MIAEMWVRGYEKNVWRRTDAGKWVPVHVFIKPLLKADKPAKNGFPKHLWPLPEGAGA